MSSLYINKNGIALAIACLVSVSGCHAQSAGSAVHSGMLPYKWLPIGWMLPDINMKLVHQNLVLMRSDNSRVWLRGSERTVAEMLEVFRERQKKKYLFIFVNSKNDCMHTDLAQQCIDSGTAAQIQLSLFPSHEETSSRTNVKKMGRVIEQLIAHRQTE